MLQQYTQSVEDFEHALGLDPSDGDAWAVLGAVLRQLGRTEEALAANDGALKLTPQEKASAIWCERARTLSALGWHEEALRAVEHATELDLNDVESWQLKGFELFTLGRTEDALIAY